MKLGSVDPNADRIAAADPPIMPAVLGTKYGEARTCIDAGGREVPDCKPTEAHPGVDLVAPKGTPVLAPHDGWLLFSGAVGAVGSEAAPWRDYGPAVVLLAHDDISDSWWDKLSAALTPSWFPAKLGPLPIGTRGTAQAGIYTVLAHLDPTTLAFDRSMDSRVNEVWGRTRVNTDNWRTVDTWAKGAPQTWGALIDDILGKAPGPQHVMKFQPGNGRSEAVYALADPNARYVRKGQLLGTVGDAKHVHWEIRVSPLGLASGGQAFDPMRWLAAYKGPLGMPVTAEAPKARGGGGGAILLLLALLAFGEKRKRR